MRFDDSSTLYSFRDSIPSPVAMIIGSLLQPSESIPQLQCQPQETPISSHRQSRQHDNNIPTRPELALVESIVANLGEELLVALLSPEETDEQDAGAVDSKECPDAVEFRSKDFEDDEREGKLAQRGADVGAFECSLGGSDFNKFLLAR